MTAMLHAPLVHDRLVVTGGGSGIGRALALTLAEEPVTAYIVGRRADALAETVDLAAGRPGRLVPVPCDLTDATAVDALFGTIEADGGPVQALAHCAASVNYQPAREITFESFQAVVATTLFTAFNAIHRWAAPLLDTGRSGVAVALTSTVAHRGTPGVAHSSAGKAGIEGYVRSVAREWGPAGLRVNCVGPGVFPVEKSESIWRDPSHRPELFDLIATGRVGELPEIVGPILFMLSEAAGYITGEILNVDGGIRLTPAGPPKALFDPAMPGIG